MNANLPVSYRGAAELMPLYDPETSMRQRSRSAVITLSVLLLLFVIGMVLIPIGGAVVASGQVGVESRVKRIAHPVGGTIAEIYVANGDHVAKGAPLMRLDDNVSGAQSELSSLTVDQLRAQRARLDAERLNLAAIVFPADLVHSTDPGAQKAMADEAKLFSLRRSESGGMRAQLTQRIAQYDKQIAGFNAQISALRKQQALIEPERQGVEDLWNKGLVTVSRRNQLERTNVDMEGSVGALQAKIAEAQAQITETRAQMIQLGETRRAEAGAQAATIAGTLNESQLRSVSADDLHARSLIRAPYSGIVDKVAFSTIGDVVKPAETIMEIVPDKDTLLVEVAASPSDVDRLKVGQKARIRFTSFNATTTPEIGGKLIFVAPERTDNPETKSSYYAARVSVSAADLKANPDIVLKPGMPAEVFIETGSRSMISYITKPLRDQLSRAFKDN